MRYFIDMDGVLCKYNFNLPSFETLYEKGYFLSRPPQECVVQAVKDLISSGEEVFVLSAMFKDSEYALFEKHEWLETHLPEVDCKHRIFTLCGEDKVSYVPCFNPKTDILVDDFGENCKAWEEAGGKYVKVSRDYNDLEYEMQNHERCICPNMNPESIRKIIG